jgi:hypothetical protein
MRNHRSVEGFYWWQPRIPTLRSKRGVGAIVRTSGGMKNLPLIAALLLAALPVAAQEQPLGAGGQTNTSQLPNTGVICQEEIAATFCNVPTAPSHGGYGSGAVSGLSAASSSGGGSSAPPSPSIPTCSEFPPANELCN